MYNTTYILPDKLIEWYYDNKRPLPFRNTNNPYKIWLSEVMLQQTQIKTVIPYYNRWLRHYPTLQSASNERIEPLLKLRELLHELKDSIPDRYCTTISIAYFA